MICDISERILIEFFLCIAHASRILDVALSLALTYSH